MFLFFLQAMCEAVLEELWHLKKKKNETQHLMKIHSCASGAGVEKLNNPSKLQKRFKSYQRTKTDSKFSLSKGHSIVYINIV